MHKLMAIFMLCVLMAMPLAATAQVWLPDRASREGPGILLGDSLVFHPGLGVEGGYDTNPLRRADGVDGAGRLRITPYLDLATRSAQRKVKDEGLLEVEPAKVDFRLGVAAYYDMFFSGDKATDDQDHFGVDTHVNFALFPSGPFSLLADAYYIRSLQPYESSQERWAWHLIKPGVGFRIRPGGGTLIFEAGYNLKLMLYEDDGISKTNNNMAHEARFITSWKILPKTSLVAKVTFAPIIYLGSESLNQDSKPVRTLFGMQGLLTDRFGLSLFVGYGASFYDQGDDFESVIAQGELMFFITPMANIRLGGQRDFVDSFYANYFEKNGGYLKYEQMFGGLVLASLKGEVFHRGYSRFDGEINEDTTGNTANRDDVWIGATLLVEVRATEWLSFHLSGNYQGNVSQFEFDYNDPANINSDNFPVRFNKFEVLAGVRAHY